MRKLADILNTTPAEMDIRFLRDAFGAATDALEDQHVKAEDRVRRKWGLGPNDRPPAFYDTELGENVEWPIEDEIENLRNYLDGAMEELRIASLVALFHAFERTIGKFGVAGKYHTRDAIKRLHEMGRNPNEGALDQLRLFANAAKHGDGNSARELAKVRPDLIRKGRVVAMPATVDFFFDAVLDSLRIPMDP